MNPTASAAKRQEDAEFAIECRKIRLWIADHDGCTSKEIHLGTGLKIRNHLIKMSNMGIIGFTMVKEPDGHRPARWFVIPM